VGVSSLTLPRCFALAGFIALGSCYGSHSSPAARKEDSGSGEDGAAGPGDAGAEPRDGGYDRADCGLGPRGLPLCSFEVEGCLGCYCWSENPAEDTVGVCLTKPGTWNGEPCGASFGCTREGQLCTDRGWASLHGRYEEGMCVSVEVCEALRARGSRARCYYGDATPYDDGRIPRTDCNAEHVGVVCGPGCGSCSSHERCLGVSEYSGLGLCVSEPVRTAIDRCGPDYDECDEDETCVRFVLAPDAPVDPGDVSGACVATRVCRELETAYPDRFRCPDE